MKSKNLLSILLAMLTLSAVAMKADTGIAFFGGLSTPGDDFSKVYNKDNFNIYQPERSANVLVNALDKGYHIGGRLKIPVNSGLVFTTGAAWNRFPKTEIAINDIHNVEVARLQIVQDLFPISAGANLYLIKSFISAYAIGELTYNYAKTTTNIMYKSVGVPLDLEAAMEIEPTSSRFGYAYGGGISFDAFLADITLEGRYNVMNLVNKNENEPYKPYFNLSIGVSFGGRPKERKMSRE